MFRRASVQRLHPQPWATRTTYAMTSLNLSAQRSIVKNQLLLKASLIVFHLTFVRGTIWCLSFYNSRHDQPTGLVDWDGAGAEASVETEHWPPVETETEVGIGDDGSAHLRKSQDLETRHSGIRWHQMAPHQDSMGSGFNPGWAISATLKMAFSLGFSQLCDDLLCFCFCDAKCKQCFFWRS